jgi:hypothetical protein
MAVSEPTAPNGPASYDVALIGCGEQAKRFYYPELEALSRRHPVRLRLVVDPTARTQSGGCLWTATCSRIGSCAGGSGIPGTLEPAGRG